MSNVIQGRPADTPTGKQFKKWLKANLQRNMLECHTVATFYEQFGGLNSPAFTDAGMRARFDWHGQRAMYDLLQQVYSEDGTCISLNSLAQYTSKKDIMYLLNKCKPLLGMIADNQTRVIKVRQLHLLLVFYLQYTIIISSKTEVINEEAIRWLEHTFPKFVSVMRNGPDRDADPTDNSYKLLELMVKWALELATHQKLSIAFPWNR